ncbi:MAG TPA: hypothetical protein VJ464_18990 [Blastocatellia bacterium]|nr:hypothetical protein [Blastocatellia bacterium]
MSKRTDDRDARKSLDEATDNPWEANKDGMDQQAAELQTDEQGERENPRRFAPDPALDKQQGDRVPSDADDVSSTEDKDKVKEP